MAKAKPIASVTASVAPISSADAAKKAKGATKKKSATKTDAPAADAGAMMIDTSLAAKSAAKMLVAGVNAPSSSSNETGEAKTESSLFKQLKAGLNKPNLGNIGSAGEVMVGRKSHKAPGFGNQVGRNQTFGADVNRTGVPRRTGG